MSLAEVSVVYFRQHMSVAEACCLFLKQEVGVHCCWLFECNADDGDVVMWFVRLGVCLDVGNLLHNFHSLRHSAKDSVLPIQPGLQTDPETMP